ncbi:MAG: TonB-dependent receptor [Pseudomonadota bacterium]
MSRLIISALAVAASLSSVADAQQAADSDEIIVTAQRRAQNSQDIGVALSVVSGQDLQNKGVTTVNGLQNITPSLSVESQFGGGQPSYSLRGVGFRDYASNNAPTVGVYVDDVAYTLPITTQGVLYDIQRVEVLRGPQGTLYGRNTTGGAINVITARPTQQFSTGFNVEYGNYNALSGEGFISGPLGGGAAARLSVVTEQGGAWQVNREDGRHLGDADRSAARLQVEFPANDRLQFLVNIHGSTDQSDGLGLRLFKDSTGPNAVAPAHGWDQTSWGFSPAFAAEHGFQPNSKPFRDNTGLGGSVTTTYDFDGATLTDILSNETFNRHELDDWDALPNAIAGVYFVSDTNVTQNELRLASKGDNVFDWIVGLYYGHEDLKDLYASDFVDSFGPSATLDVPYHQVVNTEAAFGQVEYQATPRLNLTAGARYEHERRELKDFQTLFGGASVIGTINNETGFDRITGRLAAEYRVADNVLAYASVSRGVKSGGFTAYNSFTPDAVSAFRPEQLTAYEAGFKSDLAGRTLRLNGSIFYYDYKDQQVQNGVFLPDPPPPRAIGRISNAPKSEIYGAELELDWQPVQHFNITQSLGYAHGEFREFTILDIAASQAAGVPVGRNAKGERLGPPELTYSGAFTYDGALSPSWGWTGGIDYSYRSDTDPPLLKPASGEGYGVPAYWLVNANFSVHPTESGWEFGLWGRNILNEHYDLTRNFFAGVDWSPIAAPGEPATYGVRISYRR